MFNSVNNPFNRSVSSSTSSDSNGKRQKQDPKKELKNKLVFSREIEMLRFVCLT